VYVVAVEDETWAAPTRTGIVALEGRPRGGLDFTLGPGTLVHGRVTEGAGRSPSRRVGVSLIEEGPPLPVVPVWEPARGAVGDEAMASPHLCVVRRTAAMCDLEQRLLLAMVATVGGRRPAVVCDQVLAALKWRGVPEGTVSVHAFAPEDFFGGF
jgi:hypothetical protein